MNLPAEALKDLQRCGGPVLRFIVATMVTLLSYRLLIFGVQNGLGEESHPQMYPMARLLAAIYLAVAVSAVQALFLAQLGAAIDTPLWKYKGAQDALQRFFIPWLIINLFLITLVDIQTRFLAADREDVAALLELLVLAVHVFSVPVGACIMHWGALEWKELGDALRPLGRLLSLAILPFAIGFIQYALANARLLGLRENMLADLVFLSVTDVPLMLIEVFIFALVWRICMHHRSLPPVEENPFDF